MGGARSNKAGKRKKVTKGGAIARERKICDARGKVQEGGGAMTRKRKNIWDYRQVREASKTTEIRGVSGDYVQFAGRGGEVQ